MNFHLVSYNNFFDCASFPNFQVCCTSKVDKNMIIRITVNVMYPFSGTLHNLCVCAPIHVHTCTELSVCVCVCVCVRACVRECVHVCTRMCV